MKPALVHSVAVAFGFIVAFVVTMGASGAMVQIISHATSKQSSNVIPPCPSIPLTGAGWNVPAGQYVSTGEIVNPGTSVFDPNTNQWSVPPPVRVSVWSNSSDPYYLYIMNQTDFTEVGGAGNASVGANQTNSSGAALDYLWSSGAVTNSDYTALLGTGDWYFVVYNPGSIGITVYAVSGACNAA